MNQVKIKFHGEKVVIVNHWFEDVFLHEGFVIDVFTCNESGLLLKPYSKIYNI